MRLSVSGELEPLRKDKIIGSSLEARVELFSGRDLDHSIFRSVDLSEMFITAEVISGPVPDELSHTGQGLGWRAQPSTHHKCGRCWRHLPEVSEDGALCNRCTEVLNG
jgi:isoleucyl-tRNA synthetase